jgi:SAM-dependent methyltransferase
MHLNSELLFRKYAQHHFKNDIKVLEIGPSGVPSVYQRIVNNDSITWHTLDLYESYPGITYVAKEEYAYPIEGETYDVIISGQVIEHVKKIWVWLAELKRILKKDGTLIIINPISWPYHAFPVDCWRIFPEGMKALCEDCGLHLLQSEFESLEAEHFSKTKTPTIPGQSYTFMDQRKKIFLIKFWNVLIHYLPIVRKLKVPVEVAYDTITLAKKDK